MQSQRFKNLLRSLLALGLTAALLWGLTVLTQKKDSAAKHAEFFEQDAPFDVLFIGSSRMMNGVFPMELWEDTGLVSYNLGQAGHPPPAYYWVMRLALDYQTPKLMVIDCYGMHFDAKTTGVFGLMHISMDSFPLSLTKIRAVRDMLDDPSMGEQFNEGERRSAFNLLWTFPVFHSRWAQLTAEDFHPGTNGTRGAIENHELFPGEFTPDDREKGRIFDTVGTLYLRRAIRECQFRDIPVLLTFIPLFANAEQQAAAEYAGQLAAEEGVPYLNFFELGVVDYGIDMADDAGHLNAAGARKVTEYLGRYIREHYDFPDHRGEGEYWNWNRDHAVYTEKKNEALRERQELYNYLMLLERDNVDVCMILRERALFRDELAARLLGALGVEEPEEGETPALLLVRSGGERADSLAALPERGETVETRAGTLTAEEDALTLDALRFPLPEEEADLTVIVLRDGEPVDSAGFDFAFDADAGHIVQSARK